MMPTEISTVGPIAIREGELVETEVPCCCWSRWKWCKKKKMIPRQGAFYESKETATTIQVASRELDPNRKEIRKVTQRRNSDGSVSTELQISWE
jgi:hypothetical protein